MNENEMTGAQIFTLFGLTCAATAVAVGLLGRAISKNRTITVVYSDKTLLESLDN